MKEYLPASHWCDKPYHIGDIHRRRLHRSSRVEASVKHTGFVPSVVYSDFSDWRTMQIYQAESEWDLLYVRSV